MSKRKLIALCFLAVAAIVVLFFAERLGLGRKPFSAIYVGMPEKEVIELLGPPGWYAGFGRTTLANGQIRPYFDEKGVRDLEGEKTKAWAYNEGVLVVTFRQGRVKSMFFEPMLPLEVGGVLGTVH